MSNLFEHCRVAIEEAIGNPRLRLMRPLWYHLQASRTIVPLAGIEPATSCVSGRRANQLRYKSIDLYCQRGSNP